MADKPSIPKGTRDFGPEVMLRREFIFNTIRAVFRKYGYQPLETPSMENLSVLTGKYGEEGDRLIFKILNSGDFFSKFGSDEEILDARKQGPAHVAARICDRALRYDLTVPFARYVVMNRNEIAFPFKRYQIQPVWRADRPQKGRYREFYQCDADVVGSASMINDAELIAIYDEALSNLGLQDFSILINNRKILTGFAEYIGETEKNLDICIAIDKLDKIGREGVTRELLNRGISQEQADKLFELITFEGTNEEKLAFLEGKFAGLETGLRGLAEMKEVLDLQSCFPLQTATLDLSLRLARGLNYYTGTIYEVQAHGVQIGSIGGGGRYDDLTGVFGLPDVPGVGISFGADRIYDVMLALGLFEEIEVNSTEVILVNFGADIQKQVLHILTQLRSAGISAEMYPDPVRMKKQFAYADKRKIPFTLIVGADELASGAYKLKNMQSGEQETLSLTDLIHKLRS